MKNKKKSHIALILADSKESKTKLKKELLAIF